MRIDAKSELYGLPALQVREILRNFPSGGQTTSWEYACRKLDLKKAKRLVRDLLRDGLIETAEWKGKKLDDGYYCRTEAGNRLALAKARPLKRKTAEKMLTSLITRAEAINADSKLCFQIRTLVVFGSFLNPQADVLGDLDIGYHMEARWEGKALEEAKEASRKRARERGRGFSWWLDLLTWPEREVKLALKAKTSGLSLHSLMDAPSIISPDGEMILAGPHRVVFGTVVP